MLQSTVTVTNNGSYLQIYSIGSARLEITLQSWNAYPGHSYIFLERLDLRQKSHRTRKDASFGTGHLKLKTSVEKDRYRS
jgi:hypothetical protein